MQLFFIRKELLVQTYFLQVKRCSNAATVFSGMGIAAAFKFIVDGLKVIPADVAVAFKSFKGEIGMEVYPALLGVGYIVGPRICFLHVCRFHRRMAGDHSADLSVRT